MSDSVWPDAAETEHLLRRLREGDAVAPAEFAGRFLDPLRRSLQTARHADDHLVLQAAQDAILSVIRNPNVFDPTRGDLGKFLRMAAAGDLRNAAAKERRHHRHRAEYDCVELEADGGNDSPEDGRPTFDDPDLQAAVAAMTDAERRVLDLMRAGERRTDVFAAALGIDPGAGAEAEVKRVKDRIKVRLKRARGGT